MTPKPYFIGLAGPSGSGKSCLATALQHKLGEATCGVLSLDSYYRDLGHLPVEDRSKNNFDQPAALDAGRMRADLERLKGGFSIDVPVYDFATHSRKPESASFAAMPVVIIEGIFVFCFPEVSALLDLRIYVDVDVEVCLARRLARDVHDRGRDEAGVRAQFDQWVRPSVKSWVLPQKSQADLVLDGTLPMGDLVAGILPHIPCGPQ
ncbi:MAG: uridine kinase [Verrucomicrobia bacterium]|nr:uridine kinase [Verrucomicrobiota bacterium]